MKLSSKREVKKKELPLFVTEVLTLLKQQPAEGATVVALSGDLGAGKTTWTQALGKALGVVETLTSPTFTIMKGYETTDEIFSQLVHMDAYRIDDEAELAPLRFCDILATPKTLFVIEWAEKIHEALPPDVFWITLEIKDETTRIATFSPLSVNSMD
jgi:tRNA threonylcarbamoyladenosine biosynthesis protein TsaE